VMMLCSLILKDAPDEASVQEKEIKLSRTLFAEPFAGRTGVVSVSTTFFFRFKGGRGFLLIFSVRSIPPETALSD
jgi:hypothetical protein